MRIVYCTDSICHPGGIQTVTISKANALAGLAGNEVWIAVTDNPRPDPVAPLSPAVHLVDLQVNYYQDDWKGPLYVLKGIFLRRIKHRRRLKALLREIRPDVVISTGTSEKLFLPRIRTDGRTVFIRELHFVKNYRQLAARTRYEKIYAGLSTFADYRLAIHRYDCIVVPTEEDRRTNWPGDDKVVVIPYPLGDRKPARRSLLTEKRLITAGRLVRQKNQASLIRIFAQVHARHPDWTLEIWGKGNLKQALERQVAELGLASCVRLEGHSDDVLDHFPEASAFLLTSRFEGFGYVLLEALACGLPVVSYDCPCGPKDIISDGKDGFLVPAGDEDLFAERICQLIEDEALRRRMGDAALEKSGAYDTGLIIRKWMTLFERLQEERFTQ